jgi:hypothetical protein
MAIPQHEWRATLDAAAIQLDHMGEQGWIVGGCLRDALLGRPVRDVDIAVTGDPLLVARALHPTLGQAIVPLKRQTVRLVLCAPAGAYLDLSALRGGSIAEDLRARDFTLNALALPHSAARAFLALLDAAATTPPARDTLPAPADLVDPLHGYLDLHARRLVPASEHALRTDPLRILRAARLAAALDLTVPESTMDLMRAAAATLTSVAHERVGAELALLFRLAAADHGWRVLLDAGALPPLFPQLAQASVRSPAAAAAHLLTAQAMVAVLHPTAGADLPDPARLREIPGLPAWYAAPTSRPDACAEPRIALLRWGVLTHALMTPHAPTLQSAFQSEAVPPAPTASEAAILPPSLAASARAPATAIARSWPWARHLLLAETLDVPTWRRFFAHLAGGSAGEVDVAIHTIVTALACQAALTEEGSHDAARLAQMASRGREVLGRVISERPHWLPAPLLTGADLVSDLGLAPGPQIGQLLARVKEAQLADRVTTRDEALDLARTLAARPSPSQASADDA